MTSPLHPALYRYLRRAQQQTTVGTMRLIRGTQASRGSVHRWEKQFGERLLIIPNVRVEALGLLHAHVVLTAPGREAMTCPWAVEAAWLTTNLCTERLYLHCLVPVCMRESFLAFIARVGHTELYWSSSPWQQFLSDDVEVSVPRYAPPASESDFLTRHPFLIPAVMETWLYPNTLPVAWQRIHTRLGRHTARFLGVLSVRPVNGKNYLSNAYSLLQQEQLVTQHLIRYHPLLVASFEVFLSLADSGEHARAMINRLRPVLHSVEAYPTESGYWLRLLGPSALLDAIMDLPAELRVQISSVYFHTKRRPASPVRFAYETLIDPIAKTWRQP